MIVRNESLALGRDDLIVVEVMSVYVFTSIYDVLFPSIIAGASTCLFPMTHELLKKYRKYVATGIYSYLGENLVISLLCSIREYIKMLNTQLHLLVAPAMQKVMLTDGVLPPIIEMHKYVCS